MIEEALKKGSSLISGMAKVHPETRMQWYMLEALEFFLLLGGTTSVSSATGTEESDRIIRSWNIPDLFLCDFQSVHGRRGGRPSPTK